MQTDNIAKLLSHENSLFELDNFEEICDFIVHDSYKFIENQLAIIVDYTYRPLNKIKNSYTVNFGDIDIVAISSITDKIDQTYKQLFNHFVENIHTTVNNTIQKNSTKKISITRLHKTDLQELLDKNILDNWPDNIGMELLVINLYYYDNRYINLLIFNNKKYSDKELIIIDFLSKIYSQSVRASIVDTSRQRETSKAKLNKQIKYSVSALIIILALISIKVTPTALAPAEIISEKTWLVNSPLNGIVKNLIVEPNSLVKEQQVLLEFDKLDLENSLILKQKELEQLNAQYNQSKSLAFNDPAARAEIFKLAQEINTKQQEINYAKQQLNLSTVKAPSAGVVLFKTKDDLLGRPAKVGETLMRLADRNSQVVEIWLNIDDGIKVNKDTEIFYYSNKHPFTAIPAKIKQYSYEAYLTPNNTIAYRVLAELNNLNLKKNNYLIIGDHGQVKFKGSAKIPLGQYIFQQPLAKVREFFYKII